MTNTGCPDRQRIEAYSLGKLDEGNSEKLADHIDTCASCQALLGTLADVEDTWITQLRGSAEAEGYQREPEYRAALERARAVVAADAQAGMTATFGGVSAARRLGDYQLLEKLGEGGMGTVFKALHTKLNRLAAVKLLTRARLNDPAALARFQREMLAVGQLDHPNLVRAYDAREADGTHLLVMEYLEGLNLSDLARRCGPLRPADACELVRQAAVGLQYVHEKGLVHRDIKPSNLLLTRDGQVKILDLGLAKFCADWPADEEMTGGGQVLGTTEYMAPEQFSDSRSADIRADIFGLGCTLYRFLTGQAPPRRLRGHGTRDLGIAWLCDPLTVLREARPDLPGPIFALMGRMLAEDPRQRPATPAEVAEALETRAAPSDIARLLHDAEVGADAPPHTAETPRHSAQGTSTESRPAPADRTADRPFASRSLRWKPRRRLAVAIGLMGLVFLVVGGFATVIIRFGRQGEPPTTLEVPEGSRLKIDEKGAEVILPGRGHKLNGTGSAPVTPGPSAAGRKALLGGWRSERCDVGKTSFYPVPSGRRTGKVLECYSWKTLPREGPVSSVLTGDINADGHLEIVTVEGNTIAAYDPWGKELWRRSPVADSGVSVPAGRVGCISWPILDDFDHDGAPDVLLLAGSRAVSGWSQKGPLRVIVYDGHGKVLRSFPVIDGGVTGPEPCFDFNGDGRIDVVFVTCSYRHPHALCIYDYRTGDPLWRADFADGPVLGGVGDVFGRGEKQMFVNVAFDCHVDPPVGEYDSDHCYSALFDARGRRLWVQTYQHALDGSVADLDGRGKSDLILIHSTDETAAVHLLNPEDGTPLATLDGLHGGVRRAWSIADVNGDGRKEIVLGDGKRLLVIDSKAKTLATRDAADTEVMATNDLNGDGAVEILARRGPELVVYDGQLREIARHRASGKVLSAIVSDLDGDGTNEVLLRVDEGEKTRLQIVHFAPDETAGAVDRSYPGSVASALLTALREGKPDAAGALVLPSERERVLAAFRGNNAATIPAGPKLEVRVHVDDAEVDVPGARPIRLRMGFVEGQWWVTGVSDL